MVLKTGKFTENEYLEYSKWFTDENISKFLGDIDTEWLDYILTSSEVSQLVFYDNDVLIGVIGICLPNAEHSYYTILDFSVNPRFQNHGYGTKILNHLTHCEEYKESNLWRAIVSIENKNALAFFKKNGWKSEGIEDNDYVKIFFEK
ncbi:GNAT family N-acetyltransferase [Xenorhabdus innexi]|uniref:Putative GCN5-related N-acetyltransferase n=1 Tax=Xenorhabdus innexi TaxID=290109 RepID=A0A1N6MW06_9GAMM|nr:GNAT family N-acetyltransferase [Xenorhabdus innexi]PHM37561.1 ribosomal-protein-S18-alanine acetyltransferase [Xenorhabdus innexi]SIP72954.1 putative GCN5-related N-acetyltransferase [Xenorhabdus innexi]